MHELSLWFEHVDSFQLIRSEFSSKLLQSTLECSRHRGHRSVGLTGSFGWTIAVRALSLLFVRAKINTLSEQASPWANLVEGHRGSLAASLDASIAKQSRWMHDMFGSDSAGLPLLRRILTRNNPELKRPGPVTVGINPSWATSLTIRLYVNTEEIFELSALRKIAALLDQYTVPTSTTPPPSANRPGSTFPPSRGPSALSDLRFNAPTEIGVTTFIPIFHGDLSVRDEAVEKSTMPNGSSVETRVFYDGYAVAVVKDSYSCESVPDFLTQRRRKHLDFLTMRLAELRLLPRHRRTPLSQEFLCSPTRLAYVMSVHYLIDPVGTVSETQRIAMAEPSLVGITDDPDLSAPEADQIGKIETLSHHPQPIEALEKLSFGSVSYYISWANVLAIFKKDLPNQTLALETLEVDLQRLWYKMHHFIESLSQVIRSEIRIPSQLVEQCARHYESIQREYESFRGIRPTASTDAVALRRSLERTSKLDLIFDQLSRCYKSILGQEQHTANMG